MMITISVAIIATSIALFLWIYKRFNQVYYWRTESGDSIHGTGFMPFKPALIALKDASLKQFGMYLLRFFPGPPKLIITDPQIAVKFMSKQIKYERMDDFRLGSVFHRLFSQAVGASSGGAQKRLRKMFNGCYSTEHVEQNVGMMEQECKLFLQKIVQDKKGILTMDDMIHLTFRMLMKFTYGREITDEELQEVIELREMIQTLIEDSFTNPFVKFPLYKYMPTRINRTLAEFETRWFQFNKCFEKRFAEGKLQDCHSVFYNIQENLVQNPGALSQDEFLQTLKEASLANVDITAGATAWLLLHVALYQQVQKELKTKIISSKASNQLSAEVVNGMDFLGKVVKESARKRPVIVISTPEYVTCPMMIGDFQSPSSIEVSIDHIAVNSDREVWGDAEIFNPRRFDNETPSMRKSLCRFGIGPRRCMGYRVADTFMKVLMVTLLENYTISLETHVTGDDDSLPVKNVGPFCYPCVTFKVY